MALSSGKEPGYVGRRLLNHEIGRRGRGRLKRRYREKIREDTWGAGVEEEDARDRVRWRTMTRYGDPQRDKPKGEAKDSRHVFR